MRMAGGGDSTGLECIFDSSNCVLYGPAMGVYADPSFVTITGSGDVLFADKYKPLISELYFTWLSAVNVCFTFCLNKYIMLN